MSIDVLRELTNLGIDYKTEGRNKSTSKFSSIFNADNNDISFCYYEEDKALEVIKSSNAGIILCNTNLNDKVHPKEGQQLIFTENPRLAFVRLLKGISKSNNNAEISRHSIIS